MTRVMCSNLVKLFFLGKRLQPLSLSLSELTPAATARMTTPCDQLPPSPAVPSPRSRRLVKVYGEGKWCWVARDLNARFGSSSSEAVRSSKQCRERWLHHLKPNLSKKVRGGRMWGGPRSLVSGAEACPGAGWVG